MNFIVWNSRKGRDEYSRSFSELFWKSPKLRLEDLQNYTRNIRTVDIRNEREEYINSISCPANSLASGSHGANQVKITLRITDECIDLLDHNLMLLMPWKI